MLLPGVAMHCIIHYELNAYVPGFKNGYLRAKHIVLLIHAAIMGLNALPATARPGLEGFV